VPRGPACGRLRRTLGCQARKHKCEPSPKHEGQGISKFHLPYLGTALGAAPSELLEDSGNSGVLRQVYLDSMAWERLGKSIVHDDLGL